jgi:hypothetical protein
MSINRELMHVPTELDRATRLGRLLHSTALDQATSQLTALTADMAQLRSLHDSTQVHTGYPVLDDTGGRREGHQVVCYFPLHLWKGCAHVWIACGRQLGVEPRQFHFTSGVEVRTEYAHVCRVLVCGVQSWSDRLEQWRDGPSLQHQCDDLVQQVKELEARQQHSIMQQL